jgi:hypothetical protein
VVAVGRRAVLVAYRRKSSSQRILVAETEGAFSDSRTFDSSVLQTKSLIYSHIAVDHCWPLRRDDVRTQE